MLNDFLDKSNVLYIWHIMVPGNLYQIGYKYCYECKVNVVEPTTTVQSKVNAEKSAQLHTNKFVNVHIIIVQTAIIDRIMLIPRNKVKKIKTSNHLPNAKIKREICSFIDSLTFIIYWRLLPGCLAMFLHSKSCISYISDKNHNNNNKKFAKISCLQQVWLVLKAMSMCANCLFVHGDWQCDQKQ